MMTIYILLLFMTILGSIASLFLKKASVSDNLFAMLKNYHLYIGGFLYFLSAVMNIVVLRYLDYSQVLPMTSLTYIWTMILSYVILNEKITQKKCLGVFLILIGAVAVSI